jgi:hypothetical protein
MRISVTCSHHISSTKRCTKMSISTILLFNMVTTNVTENMTKDTLTNLYDNPVYMTCCVSITAAVEIIGNGLLVVIIMYEKFGMDPQKRTTINQLLSKICWMLIMTNLTVFPFTVIRTLVGPHSELVGSWIYHAMSFSRSYIFLTVTEMMILKCLYMFFWSRMAMLDDTLVAQFIGQWNLMISSLTIFTRLYIGEYNTSIHYQFITGNKSFKDESDLSKKILLM